eukprot:CAMPEP_0181031892 /NCGR_PEP_ID=MMETSP1070-20121207/6464_1 /TAXON_ID=265543 /ORGANISM="Minutocellus polymorphus, Strain NH13" /LENGTH=448 /DNA_ID=CAMNT_0023109279 /DNA_START=73 /DNA_END=1419 /DNA_ORIENTATION=-
MSATGSGGAANPMPNLPLPPPIYSEEPGTWAYDTMSRRVDAEILQRTYEENEEEFNSPEFAEALKNLNNDLRAELQNAAKTKLRHLKDLTEEEARSDERAREYNEWKAIMDPYVEKGDTWLTAPWLVTEFYAYRRLMEALGYFDKTKPTYMWDPFAKAKKAGLDTSVSSAENVMDKIEALPNTKEGAGIAAAFSLWANKMDLSIWPADSENASVDVFEKILHSAEENLLHDDVDVLTDYCEQLRTKGGGMIDIIVDNAGFELVCDLALADHLVASETAKTVTFQLKAHPTFVSDALEKDLIETVEYYAALDASKYPNAKRAGLRWKKYLDEGKWVCSENFFWCQPFAMWEMTEPLRSDMKERCDLAFVKGDANYRRLLGDRLWDLTAPFQDVVGCYFPCPVCALRTLKAELGCGMDAEQVERAKTLDDAWMTNGRFGVVQFGTGAGKE